MYSKTFRSALDALTVVEDLRKRGNVLLGSNCHVRFSGTAVPGVANVNMNHRGNDPYEAAIAALREDDISATFASRQP